MSRVKGTGVENDLTDQEAFELLSSRRRRLVLESLHERGGQATLGELARAVAARENDVPVEEVTRRQRRRVYTALRQSHLPRMAEAAVVEYDPDRGEVELRPAAETLRRYLENGRSEVEWPMLYGSVALTAALGLLASVANLPAFATLTWRAWLLAAVVGVTALAAVQYATGAVPPQFRDRWT